MDPLVDKVRSILDHLSVSPANTGLLTQILLHYQVHKSPSVKDIASLIFDKAISQPELCESLSALCRKQVEVELAAGTDIVAAFCNALLARVADTFEEQITFVSDEKHKLAEIAAEVDASKKSKMQQELRTSAINLGNRQFSSIMFIGHLFLVGIISARVVITSLFTHLQTIWGKRQKPEDLGGYKAEDIVFQCSIRLLEIVGKKVHDESAAGLIDPFLFEQVFEHLQAVKSFGSSNTISMISNLEELRENGWEPKKEASKRM